MKIKNIASFALALSLAASVGITMASAQTTGSTGYDMLNAQSASGPTYGSSSTTANSIYPSPAASVTTDPTATYQTTSAAAPGVPNTGSGGDAPVNLAVLIVSGLVVAAGMTYVTLKLAL